MMKIARMLFGILAVALMLTACAPAPAMEEATPAPEATATLENTEETSDTLEFSLTTLTGETLDETVFTGNKLVMVNYWATWCGPCVSEIPDLIKISDNYADKGFALIGVLTGDNDISGAKALIEAVGMRYPVVLPEGFFLDHADGIYAIPTTLFFDAEGNQINAAVVGEKSYDDWAGLIDLLLERVS